MNKKIINIKKYLEKSKKTRSIYTSNSSDESGGIPLTGVDIDTESDGAKYVGEFKDGLRHGKGTFIFPDGRKYVGEWKDNMLHGQGTFTYPDGGKYVGEFKDDMFHGQGTFTYSNGEKYVGEFKNHMHHGQGTFTSSDGFVLKGLWEEGEFKRNKKGIVPPINESK